MKKPDLFFHIFSGLPRNTSFRQRLFISFLVIAIPVLAAMAIFSYALTSNSTKQTLIQAQETQVGHLNARLLSVYSNIESISRDIILSSDIQDYMRDAGTNRSYPDDSAVSYTISALMTDRDFIDSIVITGNTYTLFSTTAAYTDKASFNGIREKWWYRDLLLQDRSAVWYSYATLSTQRMKAQQNGEIPDQINTQMLARPIYSVDTPGMRLGYLMIYTDNDYMQNLWRSLDWGSTTNLYLIDRDGNVIDSNRPMRDYSNLISEYGISDQNGFVRYEGSPYLYSCADLGINGWRTVMITPYNELNRPMSNIVIILLILIAALVFIIFLMSNRSSYHMARPIAVLSHIMDSYHGSDTVPDPELVKPYEDRTDEIGDIYRSYAQLQERIQNLIQEIYVKNLEKKDAELALLQSQINPHFLYNTLDSINWLALMHDEEEISNMITALSDTFRLSLMKSNSYFVEMSAEAEYVSSYLMLQKFRYGDKLNYTVTVPPEAEKLYIPRFILQPLVENALKHGISKLPNGGKIDIEISVEENLIILVKNDGSDIDLEKMGDILVYHPSESELLSFKPEGYGVQNIFRRIKVICGEEYGLSYSVERARTVCRITLPIKETDDSSSGSSDEAKQ
ncbi:MAG: sensor histidine kinase [Eubacterium sp.]|nr:sensor histidine kinase [Eubacterium sp.]